MELRKRTLDDDTGGPRKAARRGFAPLPDNASQAALELLNTSSSVSNIISYLNSTKPFTQNLELSQEALQRGEGARHAFEEFSAAVDHLKVKSDGLYAQIADTLGEISKQREWYQGANIFSECNLALLYRPYI